MDLERIVEFAGNHPLLVAALVMMIALVIFHEVRRATHGSTQLLPGEAVRLINRGAHVIDVREAEAFHTGHIVAARNLPAGTLKEPGAWLNKQRKKPLLLVCDNGSASAKAAGELQKQGFEQVYSLRGGLNAWRQENFPVVRDDEKKAEKSVSGKKGRKRGSQEDAA